MLARERQYISKCASWRIGIDTDVEVVKNSKELDRARLGDSRAPLGAEQNIPDLQRPERRHVSGCGEQTFKKPPCRWRALIIEAPSGCDRGVENESDHRLPSSRSVFHDSRPSVWPLAKALARATGSPEAGRREPPTGTSRATATPRRVITISAPRETSSSNSLKCVFASKVPISFMVPPAN
jgi:hypothetical protein